MCKITGVDLPVHRNSRGGTSPLTFAPCQLGKQLSTILLVLLNLPLDVDKSNKATEATGPFHSLVIPAQAGIHIVLPWESCHRPR